MHKRTKAEEGGRKE